MLEIEDRNGSGTTEMDEVDALLSYANDLGVLDSFTDRGGRLLASQSPKSVSASGHSKHNKRGNESGPPTVFPHWLITPTPPSFASRS